MLAIKGRGESGQDHFAFNHNGCKANGTFIDIGANEPITFNNTYALEEVGWRGWCIDIEPSYVPLHKQYRKSPFLCADARTVDWKALVGNTPMPINYLSLDIDENQERDLALTILQNLVAANLSFRCMTVEHDAYRFGDDPRLKLRKFLLGAGYKLEMPDIEIRRGCGKPFEDWWTR